MAISNNKNDKTIIDISSDELKNIEKALESFPSIIISIANYSIKLIDYYNSSEFNISKGIKPENYKIDNLNHFYNLLNEFTGKLENDKDNNNLNQLIQENNLVNSLLKLHQFIKISIDDELNFHNFTSLSEKNKFLVEKYLTAKKNYITLNSNSDDLILLARIYFYQKDQLKNNSLEFLFLNPEKAINKYRKLLKI